MKFEEKQNQKDLLSREEYHESTEKKSEDFIRA